MYTNMFRYKWYAVYTRVNQEKKIIRLLHEQKIENYLPLVKKLKQWCDRKKWIEEPLFRCYLFVKVSNKEFFKVLDTPGVVGYVCFGGQAQSIPDYQIENVKTFVTNSNKEITITRSMIAEGMNAQVLYGPLKGVQGEVIEIYGQSRILIRIETLGCCLHTNISKDEVRLLPPLHKTKNENNGKNQHLVKNKRRVKVKT